ncbi:MAG: N-acetylglucosamine-6-phosphate deacetylase [Acidimicrobiaceae bacterium]|nr:N-acetylglucosamine-6-phosphate deacetylase [Acidimicrobiaceae bacterium]
MNERVLSGMNVVTPTGVVLRGWVHIVNGVIIGVGDVDPPANVPAELVPGWAYPGFVDLHMHGGDGRDASGSSEDVKAAVAFHGRHGTTSTLVSLVTAPVEELVRSLANIATAIESRVKGEPTILGAHLEGPFLAHAQCGAQNPKYLQLPNGDLLREFIAAARGNLRVITLAPELPGAMELIDIARSEGVVVAVGHTDASYEVALEAFRRGATIATHLYNGMRPFYHRDPGPSLAALTSGALCEIINDGVHVHPAVARDVVNHSQYQLTLVTDAMSATGIGDGQYQLGGLDVVVTDGVARLRDSDGLAGSTLTMDDAVRRALATGLSVHQVALASSVNACRALGVNDRGGIEVGRRADIVLFTEELTLREVVIA